MIQKQDIKLLACLRENARDTITHISKKTQIPISTVYERIKRHKETTIQRFSTLLDFTKFGYMVKAIILFKIYKTDKKRIKEFFMLDPNVNSMYKVNNGYDYMIEVVFRTIKDMEEFLENLDEEYKIKHKEVHYLIDDLKREAFVPEL